MAMGQHESAALGELRLGSWLYDLPTVQCTVRTCTYYQLVVHVADLGAATMNESGHHSSESYQSTMYFDT